jgi:hypothetical protein
MHFLIPSLQLSVIVRFSIFPTQVETTIFLNFEKSSGCNFLGAQLVLASMAVHTVVSCHKQWLKQETAASAVVCGASGGLAKNAVQGALALYADIRSPLQRFQSICKI